MSYAVFKKSSLRNYDIISSPGTYKVVVSNSVKPNYLLEDEDKSRYLVNFRAGTLDNLKSCLKEMGNAEIVPFAEVRDFFFTGALWENQVTDLETLPVKGEEVIANFDYVDDILRCTSITLIPRKKLEKFDLDSICDSRNLFRNLLEKSDE